MNTKNLFIAALLALACLITLPAVADILENPNGYNSFGDSGITQGTTNAYYVAGNYTLGKGSAVVRYLNVSSDLAASKVQFYNLTNAITVSSLASGSTNMVVSSTNGFAANNIVVIKHIATDRYERLPVLTVALTNQITVQWGPLQTPAAGDIIWKADPSGFINIGAASNNVPISAGSSYAGQFDKPLLIEINGTSWAQINTVSGDYR